MGEDPLDRERLNRLLWARGAGRDGAHDRRGRHRAVGHRRQKGGHADPPPARHLPRQRSAPMPARRSTLAPRRTPSRRGITRRPAGPPTRSTRRSAGARTSRCARRCARRSATSTRSCSIRPGATATRKRCGSAARSRRWAIYWYEDPLAEQDIYNYVKLQAEARHPDPRHRIPDRRPRFLHPVDHRARHRLSARRCRGQGRHHDPAQDGAPRRGLPDELRGAPRRQFAEQCRQSARHHGDPEHRVLRGVAARRDAEIRAGAGHRGRTATGWCTPRPVPASAPRSISS